MTDLPTPQDLEPSETVVEVPTSEGLLRVEMEHDPKADKVTRHDFYLDDKKITKKKALSLGSA